MAPADPSAPSTSLNKNRPLWEPDPVHAADSNLSNYSDWLARKTGKTFSAYNDLYAWSVDHVDKFWESIWDYSKLKHSKSYDSVLAGDSMFESEWFTGARLNFSENLLRYQDDNPAIIFQCETGEATTLSYQQLYDQVAAVARWMRKFGLTKGERVAALMPNRPETIVAMLAATSVGAIWSSCSPDFGKQGVLDRFSQIKPKLLISTDQYQYGGKQIDLTDTLREIASELPTLQQVMVVSGSDNAPFATEAGYTPYDELLNTESDSIEFEQLPFDHPVYIMYSSGTTGSPKGIVHGAGGTLLQHFKEHTLHNDLSRQNRLFYFTTCGWMMWNWLVGALQVGATICLYDGSPFYPDDTALWKWVEKKQITHFGTSPKYLAACQAKGLKPKETHDLSSLRAILSTGAPLATEHFEYVYRDIKPDVRLSSISGGTDIISCFMLGNPNLPVYSGEIQCRGLGMKVEVFNAAGTAVTDEVGELVCTAPFPSRPVSFWNDPERKKYRAAYFNHFPGVWRHGDFVKLTERGSLIVYGRSDSTLNPGGVRIGTSEIYGPVESMEVIVDSVVVGQQWENDVRVILFVVLAEGERLTEELITKIKQRLRSKTTARHLPAVVIQIDEVPRTINGKKVELAVADIIHGRPVDNRSALANPEVLRQFVDLAELGQ